MCSLCLIYRQLHIAVRFLEHHHRAPSPSNRCHGVLLFSNLSVGRQYRRSCIKPQCLARFEDKLRKCCSQNRQRRNRFWYRSSFGRGLPRQDPLCYLRGARSLSKHESDGFVVGHLGHGRHCHRPSQANSHVQRSTCGRKLLHHLERPSASERHCKGSLHWASICHLGHSVELHRTRRRDSRVVIYSRLRFRGAADYCH